MTSRSTSSSSPPSIPPHGLSVLLEHLSAVHSIETGELQSRRAAGSARSSGEPQSDAELARAMFAEEAEGLLNTAKERIVLKGDTEGDLLEELIKIEETARYDRALAIALSQGRDPPPRPAKLGHRLERAPKVASNVLGQDSTSGSRSSRLTWWGSVLSAGKGKGVEGRPSEPDVPTALEDTPAYADNGLVRGVGAQERADIAERWTKAVKRENPGEDSKRYFPLGLRLSRRNDGRTFEDRTSEPEEQRSQSSEEEQADNATYRQLREYSIRAIPSRMRESESKGEAAHKVVKSKGRSDETAEEVPEALPMSIPLSKPIAASQPPYPLLNYLATPPAERLRGHSEGYSSESEAEIPAGAPARVSLSPMLAHATAGWRASVSDKAAEDVIAAPRPVAGSREGQIWGFEDDSDVASVSDKEPKPVRKDPVFAERAASPRPPSIASRASSEVLYNEPEPVREEVIERVVPSRVSPESSPAPSEAPSRGASPYPRLSSEPREILPVTAPHAPIPAGIPLSRPYRLISEMTPRVCRSIEICCVCRDEISGSVIRSPCQHTFDTTCMRKLYSRATIDESSFPPKCCGFSLDFKHVEPYLNDALKATYKQKAYEYSIPDRVYCSNTSCTAFLGAAFSGPFSVELQCFKCALSTCARCKERAHPSAECHLYSDSKVLELGEEKGWRRCPSCRHLVELDSGCYHVKCRCSGQFCYLCGAVWKTCECDLFYVPPEDELEVAAGPAAAAPVTREVVHARPRAVPVEFPQGRVQGAARVQVAAARYRVR
ncbi:hypothetical protein PYCCODRAFT_1474892 [Trametes coccinea BRFM310]|uniref:RBR-type E3 ubiquitin transferase n=1 Tax=Trametes coccinea (strain BRFM310) TaxID=1353009 RepID=A0A1Y2IXY8_TRAC3|nr:hypothetical protein PYCCODRAFT_1474892 [Trametes coccinea BRFM310]